MGPQARRISAFLTTRSWCTLALCCLSTKCRYLPEPDTLDGTSRHAQRASILHRRTGPQALRSTRRQHRSRAGMLPDDAKPAPREHRAVARATTKPSAGRDGGLAVVAVGGQRGTLYDSFELNAMALRLNRLLNGDGGEARRPRKAAGSWLAAPKVLFRKIKCAFLGGRRGGV